MTAAPSIGTAIKRARERHRWTQRDLAAKLGVDVKSVSNWETGRTSPKNSIGALEVVLGISLTAAPEPEPETEWQRWERSVLENPHIEPEVARAIVTDARRAVRSAAPAEPAAPSSREHPRAAG